MIRVARLVAVKDLRVEWRSRVILWQVLPFGVMTLLLMGFAEGPETTLSPSVAAGLFYVVVLFVSMLVIARSATIESSPGTANSISMLGLDPAGVFLGKATAVFLEVLLSALILLAGTTLLLHLSLALALHSLPSVVLVVMGLSLAGTLYGALTSGLTGSPTLLPLLVLPTMAPLLIAGERTISAIATHQTWSSWLGLLIVFDVGYTVAGILLYGVVEDS